MTKQRWAALALVVSLMVAVQHYGLERQPETLAEAPTKRVADLPANQVLPTYVATLFFGAFRAVAVDILWIQLRKVKEEKRWYEMKEVTYFISYVQPRNPEVWSHLAWDSAYNIANGFTDKEESWKWVKFGLLWLRRGISTLPNEPYLKHQLAYTLWHKPGWRDGELDLDLLRRIEADPELQAALPPDGTPKSDKPRSAFELALPWLERAREELMDKEAQITQMGLVLYPETMDGFARYCMMLQGMYEWKRDRHEDAKAWFRRTKAHVEDMLARTPESPSKPGFEKKYKNSLSIIFPSWVQLYAGYPELVDLELKARSRKPEDERALLAHLQGLIVKHGAIDEMWLYNKYNPLALLNAVKMRVAKDDTMECNDSFDMVSDLRAGDLATVNLAPEGLDDDYFGVYVANPDPNSHSLVAPKPVQVTMELKRPIRQGLKVKWSLYNPSRQLLKEEVAELTDRPTLIRWNAPEYARYYLKIQMEPPTLPWPADTRYHFQYALEY